MSLQVWLPLTGDLHNQGLSNLPTPSQNTLIYNANGKIGQCATGTCAWHLTEDILDNQWSIALWIKTTSTFGVNNNIIFCKNTTGSDECQIYFSIINGTSLHIGVNGPSSSLSQAYTFATNTWYHVAATYDGTIAKLYINGIFQKQTTVTTTKPSGKLNIRLNGRSTNAANTSQTGSLNGYNFNDFRIYDHALSDKEVEEIAKGLVLHYKLDNDGLGNKNILPISMDLTKWPKESGVSVEWDSNKNMYKIITTGKTSSRWGIYQNITLTANTTYTFSVDGMKVDQACAFGFAEGNAWPGNTGSFTTDRQRLSKTITVGSADAICRIYLNITCTNGGTNNAYFALPKLEVGDVATDWSPATVDGLTTDNIVYDSSGYQHDGELINSPTFIADTARFNSCLHMSATNQKVKITGLTTTGFSNSYSFAWWEKISSTDPMHWGFADGVRLNGMYTGHLWNTGDGSNNPLYKPGTTTQVSNPSVNVWHHWVMTGDGNKCRVYQDGILWGEAKTYKTISGTTIYINGWDAGTSYCSNNASMSDFRIYATALTAEQVLDLYHTSASIDKEGNIYARELVEE